MKIQFSCNLQKASAVLPVLPKICTSWQPSNAVSSIEQLNGMRICLIAASLKAYGPMLVHVSGISTQDAVIPSNADSSIVISEEGRTKSASPNVDGSL